MIPIRCVHTVYLRPAVAYPAGGGGGAAYPAAGAAYTGAGAPPHGAGPPQPPPNDGRESLGSSNLGSWSGGRDGPPHPHGGGGGGGL
ncbi:hypothetical protein GCK72_018569 [Caenorhabditis remanei]|uniref:Uncharacterized protein n=1 Tax=Caenorhabditis remanei TaxID=31234 RepID=A0A6A5GBM9_CAERE|nr:hypothetical protein GCK72_018569 [Caenorhabditis remanei]KAF1752015.1 hypothetical protein GCK72_018569 [Caenorhabditis remanei]